MLFQNLVNNAGRLGELAVRKAKFIGEIVEPVSGKRAEKLEKFTSPKSKK